MHDSNYPLLYRWPFKHYRLILLALFIIYMTFFDRYCLINQYKIYTELRDLRAKSKWYKQQTEYYRMRLQQVLHNPEETERFVRENYLMQRPGEKVFIVDR